MHLLRAAALLTLLLSFVTTTPAAPVSAETSGGSPLTTVATAESDNTVADLLDVLTYSVHSIRRNSDGTEIEKTRGGLVGVPTLVDVDRGLVPVPDFSVSVTPLPTPTPRVRLDIVRLAATKVPALVEVVFDLPGGARGVAFGVDGRADTAPVSFSTTVRFSTGDAVDLATATRTSGAGSTMTLVASLFTRGAGTERLDPTEASVALTPVPASLTTHAHIDPVADAVSADLASSAPTTADVLLNDQRPGSTLRLSATVDQVPSSISLNVTGDAAHGRTVTYNASETIGTVSAAFRQVKSGDVTDVEATVEDVPAAFTLDTSTPPVGPITGTWTASARVGSLDADVRQSVDGGAVTQVVAKANDVARSLSFTKDGNRASFSADAPVGAIEAGLSSAGPVVLATDEPADYVKAIDGSLAVRILGLRSFTINTADPVTVRAELAPATLHADLALGGRHIDGIIDHLPSVLRNLSFSETAGVLDYRANEGIDRITVEVQSDTPIIQRADRARLTVRDLPPELTLDFGDKAPATVSPRRVCEIGEDLPECDPFPGDGGGEEDPGEDTDPTDQFPNTSMKQRLLLDANGATVGSTTLLLTSGPDAPDAPIPAGQDGVVIEDLADHFVLFARVTGLQFAFVDLLVDDKRNTPGGRFLTTHHAVNLRLDPEVNGRRALVVDHRRQQGLVPGAKVDRLHVFVTDLPHEVAVDFRDFQEVFVSPLPRLTQAVYTASEPIRSVTLEADVPGIPNPVFLRVENVPTLITLCKASDNACGEQEKSDHGSFRLHSSSPARLSAFLCFDEAPCTHDDPSAFTDGVRLQDVTVQDLEFELNIGDLSADDPFQVRLDTNGNPVTGDIQLMGGGIVDVKFPGPWLIDPNDVGGLQILGEWVGPLIANNRQVTFDKQVFEGPLLPQFSGSIEENPATCIQAEIPVLGAETIFGDCA